MAKFDHHCNANVGHSHDHRQLCMYLWSCWPMGSMLYVYSTGVCCTLYSQRTIARTVETLHVTSTHLYLHFETISFISGHCCDMSSLTSWSLENITCLCAWLDECGYRMAMAGDSCHWCMLKNKDEWVHGLNAWKVYVCTFNKLNGCLHAIQYICPCL